MSFLNYKRLYIKIKLSYNVVEVITMEMAVLILFMLILFLAIIFKVPIALALFINLIVLALYAYKKNLAQEKFLR